MLSAQIIAGKLNCAFGFGKMRKYLVNESLQPVPAVITNLTLSNLSVVLETLVNTLVNGLAKLPFNELPMVQLDETPGVEVLVIVTLNGWQPTLSLKVKLGFGLSMVVNILVRVSGLQP